MASHNLHTTQINVCLINLQIFKQIYFLSFILTYFFFFFFVKFLFLLIPSDSASVVVHVINGEHPAAMQHGNSSANSIFTANYYRISQQIVTCYATTALLSHQMTHVTYNFKRYLLRLHQQVVLVWGIALMGITWLHHSLIGHKHIQR